MERRPILVVDDHELILNSVEFSRPPACDGSGSTCSAPGPPLCVLDVVLGLRPGAPSRSQATR
jgi:hypothetical protein